MASRPFEVKPSDRSIEVGDLTFAYGAEPVLKNVTFRLEQRSVGLLGPNGSGKTTLLRALLGHLKVPAGAVKTMGWDMARDAYAARRHVGWMPERGGILPGMSGVAMVAYLGELGGMPRTDALQRSHEVLNYVGLADERYRAADTYSQGMRQRLKLAQALVHDPAWLFLDEPTAGLDPRGRLSMLDLVKDLAKDKGFGVILSTHLLADVKAVCEEIVVLRQGELLKHGRVNVDAETRTAQFVMEGFGDADVFAAALAERGIRAVKEDRQLMADIDIETGPRLVLEAAEAADYALRRMQRHTETLEDLFFQLVDESGDEAAGVLEALTGREGGER
jgi:ABC-2 type transport system ATP-binding protein